MLSLLAEAPALPLHTAGKYVAAAYIVFVLLLVIYLGIMAAKLQRIERELRDLAGFAEANDKVAGPADQGSQGGGARPGGSGRAARRSDRPSQSDSSGGSEAAAFESEEAVVDEARPSPGTGHGLSLPGPDEGRADHAESPPEQGVPHV
jgi:hypothetical protein